MDVGFYLGELLMQQGEVSVPGLGYFVQVRMSGHYDEVERKFYPPYHQVQFDVQSIDDDALAEYIAVKKNISIASAKYFSEKYITNLKQQALIEEVPIGNLGYFYTEFAQLTFKPVDKIIDDTIFYGFEPISVNKVSDMNPLEERPKVELNFPPNPDVTEEIPQGLVQSVESAQQPARAYHPKEEMAGVSPEFFEAAEDEEEQKKSPLMLILIIFTSVLTLASGVFALYEYKPDTFARMVFWKHKTIVVDSIKPKPIVVSKPDTIATDSLTADSLKKDSIAAIKKDTVAIKTAVTVAKKTEVIVTQPATLPKKKEVIIPQTEVPATISKLPVTKPRVVPPANSKILAAPSEAAGTRRFEVYAVNATTIADANAAIKKLKKAGLDPRWVTDAGGTTYPISIGHFPTKEDARKFASGAIELGKVPGGNAYFMEVVPQVTKPIVVPQVTKPIAVPAGKPVTAMDKLEDRTRLVAPPSTAVGTRRFEVNAATCNTVIEANAAIRKMRKAGFDPRIVTDAPGTEIHVSIGHFATKDEATALAKKGIESGAMKGGDAYGIEIIPNK